MHIQRWPTACAAVTAAIGLAAPAAAQNGATVESGRPSSRQVQAFASDLAAAPALSHADTLALLQKHIKYVFVIFQENRSFDQYFGTFPGADGLFSKPPAQTPGFVQKIVDTDGRVATISPFLIPQTVTDAAGKAVPLYPADTDSVDHSHRGIDNGLDLDAAGVARNDRYALNAEGLTTTPAGDIVTLAGRPPTAPPTLLHKQRAELVMAHLDCDTVPFLWQYADRFTLFDNFHQTIIGPSTPNAIAMIAGQSGDTQWVLHPGTPGEPVVSDPGPFAGSNLDHTAPKPPYGPPGVVNPDKPARNQTYATLPLSFMGPDIARTIAFDPNPTLDLLDVQHDIETIAGKNPKPIPWGWYQQGYDHEPTDASAPASHAGYVTHHNAAQYFGYLGDNPVAAARLHGLADFYRDLAERARPPSGVFYVRGGYGNLDGLRPLDPGAAVQANFTGNDDHPAYSDAQISEALVADAVNAIANSPYWPDSAIIITYDETDGLYDHAAFKPRSVDADRFPLDGGPRIPAIVISPYSAAHAIAHDYSEHSSVIRFIDELFNLVPLGDLPDEAAARELGKTSLGQSELGPGDTVAGMGDLFSAFDTARLTGKTPPLPFSYALIATSAVTALPHYGGAGCRALDIVPTDYVDGKLIDPPPADFNPRPGTSPGIPTSGTWMP
jgi:phospholipase C